MLQVEGRRTPNLPAGRSDDASGRSPAPRSPWPTWRPHRRADTFPGTGSDNPRALRHCSDSRGPRGSHAAEALGHPCGDARFLIRRIRGNVLGGKARRAGAHVVVPQGSAVILPRALRCMRTRRARIRDWSNVSVRDPMRGRGCTEGGEGCCEVSSVVNLREKTTPVPFASLSALRCQGVEGGVRSPRRLTFGLQSRDPRPVVIGRPVLPVPSPRWYDERGDASSSRSPSLFRRAAPRPSPPPRPAVEPRVTRVMMSGAGDRPRDPRG